MSRINRGKPLRVDPNMVPLGGGQAIVEILNLDVTNLAWTPVRLPNVADLACKAFFAKLRGGGAWRLSHLAAGARFLSIAKEFAVDLVQDRNALLFYVQSIAASDVFEIMFLD